MTLTSVADRTRQIIDTLKQVIVGKDEVLEQVLLGLLTNGHILIEDYPGLAKTLIARLCAQVTDLDFKRIQFTPDLLPSDITGSFLYNQREGTFEFRRGPVFTNLLLADEINRATPKTQAALLEVMQEHQVTVEGERFVLDPPFLVIATQNPLELEGTYPLPEAQLDRFLMRLRVGYPTPDDEQEILLRRRQRRQDTVDIAAVVTRAELLKMQSALEEVFVSPEIDRYIVAVVLATRQDGRVQVGASPRGSLALMKLARTYAALHGRDFVTPDDVKAMAVPALAHRLILRPELWITKVAEEDIVRDLLHKVPTPKADI
ncbi:MAG TPA: MoxR family ATPase [Alphaproteobacteria bacterium]|nr:MoxR family ATPase [Alphaproteobacteria bacterium]